MDRAIRPLFDQEDKRDVQVIISVLAVDGENDYDVISLLAASAALSISGINWQGPIGAIRVGLINGQFVFNPSYVEQDKSDLDLLVAGTCERLIMVEAGANEVPEQNSIGDAIVTGLKSMKPVLDLLAELKANITPKERVIKPVLKVRKS